MIEVENRNLLLSSLQDAVLDAASAQSVDMKLMFQLMSLRDNQSNVLRSFVKLRDTLAKTPELEIFQVAKQQNPILDQSVDTNFLVGWMISRAQKVGASQTVEDLETYLSQADIELTERLLIEGISLEAAIELPGYILRPWRTVPVSDDVYRIKVRQFFGGSEPDIAIERIHVQQPMHFRPWSLPPNKLPLSIQPIWDVARLAALLSGSGITLHGQMIEGPSWAPWKAYSSSFGRDQRRLSVPRALTVDLSTELESLVVKFSSLDEFVRERLRLPMDRLSNSRCACFNFVDRAIELGVAVESLFVPQRLGEGISRTIRARAAIFLGSTAEQRRDISEKMKWFYDLRSMAVHSGRLDDKQLRKELREDTEKLKIFEFVEDQLVFGIKKIILIGEPDWEELEIGNS